MHTLRTLSLATTLALLAVSASAQDQHMLQPEPKLTQSEQAAAFDNWLEQAGPRIAWRNDTINAIVQRMAPQLAQLPEGGTTAADLAMGLHRMNDGQLQAATAHQQLLGLEAAINQGVAAPSAKIAGGVDKAGLGDRSNLVFVPITPCRIADSRKADEGKLQRNVVRSYYKYPISNHGAESGCSSDYYSSIGSGHGISPALALTVTATQAEGSGHLSIKPVSFFSSPSETSVLNFRPGETIANSTVVAARTMDAPNLPDFWITPSQPVHVIVDLLGFYLPSEPASLWCSWTPYTSATVYQSNIVVAPQCEAGYTPLSVACYVQSGEGVLQEIGADRCKYKNIGSAPLQAQIATRCCQVPGRERR